MAFRMNASLRKVLRKVLTDFIITKLDVRWSGIRGGRRKDAPEQRGFQDGVDFRLGAIEQLTERKKERETSRKAPNTINMKMIEKGGTYA